MRLRYLVKISVSDSVSCFARKNLLLNFLNSYFELKICKRYSFDYQWSCVLSASFSCLLITVFSTSVSSKQKICFVDFQIHRAKIDHLRICSSFSGTLWIEVPDSGSFFATHIEQLFNRFFLSKSVVFMRQSLRENLDFTLWIQYLSWFCCRKLGVWRHDRLWKILFEVMADVQKCVLRGPKTWKNYTSRYPWDLKLSTSII